MTDHSIQEFPNNHAYAYSHVHKPAFQPTSKSGQAKQVTSLSGTSINDVSYSSHRTHRNQQIQQLYKRIEYLEKELEQVTDLLAQQQASKNQMINELEKANGELMQNLEKTDEMNSALQKQLRMSEQNNERLCSALKDMNDELEELKCEMKGQKMQQNVSESKSSLKTTKTNKQLQDDIIRLNEQIQKILQKFHLLNQDYSSIQQHNENLQTQNQQLMDRITTLQKQLSATSSLEQLTNKYELSQDENQLLKQEIEKVSQMSIAHQKQVQDQYFAKQSNLFQQIQSLSSQIQILSKQNMNQSKIHQLSKQLSEQQQENAKLINKVAQLERKSRSIMNQNYEERQQILRRSYESKIKHLNQLIDISREQDEIKRLQIDRLSQKKQQLSSEVTFLKQKLIKLEAHTGKTEEMKVRYESQIIMIKQRFSQIQKTAQIRAKQIRQLQQQRNLDIENQDVIEMKENMKMLQKNNKELQKMLLDEKEEKNKQNNRYKQLLEDYKKVNEDITNELNLLRDLDHGDCPLKTDMSRYGEMEKKVENEQKLMNFLRVQNASLKSKQFNLSRKNEEQRIKIMKMEQDIEFRRKQYECWKSGMERQLKSKLQLQKTQIINEYNALLRDRQVKLDLNYQKSVNSNGNTNLNMENQMNISNATHYSFHTVKIHPQYKKIQEDLVNLNRQYLQMQHNFNKNITLLQDQNSKLKIQNQYHRNTIDQLHAQGYGISSNHQQIQKLTNRNEQLHQEYQKLYHQYVQLKQQHSRKNSLYMDGSWNGIGFLEAKVDPNSGKSKKQELHHNFYSSKQKNWDNKSGFNELNQLNELKRVVDEKIQVLEVTPRESSSIVERAIWMLEKMSAMVGQLRQDQQTIRRQKKQANKQCDKLSVRLETLQYEKTHLLKELAIVAEKLKYLQERNYRMGMGNGSNKNSQRDEGRQNLGLKLHEDNNERSSKNSVERDVHLHEAGLIRQQRLALLRKYQQEIQSVASKTH